MKESLCKDAPSTPLTEKNLNNPCEEVRHRAADIMCYGPYKATKQVIRYFSHKNVVQLSYQV